MCYSKLTDEQLIGLLYSEEDRLPRAAVDEFVKRGGRMIEPPATIAGNDINWTKEGPQWWAVIHAVFILAAIGGEETVIPLLKSLRFSCAYDCDWVSERVPSIFGKIGIKAIEGLKMIASDYTTEWYTRTLAIEGLAAITLTNPDAEKDIFAFIGAVFLNENEDKDARSSAGNILLDFQKEEFKESLLSFGKAERQLKDNDCFYCLNFDDNDVRRAFNSPEENLRHYQREWLAFYDEHEIRQRQERWESEAAEQLKEEKEEAKESGALLYPDDTPFAREGSKTGRNAPCPCGSGKKYKKCCGK